jgi:hypothetical protein
VSRSLKLKIFTLSYSILHLLIPIYMYLLHFTITKVEENEIHIPKNSFTPLLHFPHTKEISFGGSSSFLIYAFFMLFILFCTHLLYFTLSYSIYTHLHRFTHTYLPPLLLKNPNSLNKSPKLILKTLLFTPFVMTNKITRKRLNCFQVYLSVGEFNKDVLDTIDGYIQTKRKREKMRKLCTLRRDHQMLLFLN